MNPTVDPTKMCVSKKVSYIGLFVLVVVGYALFSFFMLQKKEVTNSRAAQVDQSTQVMVKHTEPRGSEYLYKIQGTTELDADGVLKIPLSVQDASSIESLANTGTVCIAHAIDRASGAESYLGESNCKTLLQTRQITGVTGKTLTGKDVGVYIDSQTLHRQ